MCSNCAVVRLFGGSRLVDDDADEIDNPVYSFPVRRDSEGGSTDTIPDGEYGTIWRCWCCCCCCSWDSINNGVPRAKCVVNDVPPGSFSEAGASKDEANEDPAFEYGPPP